MKKFAQKNKGFVGRSRTSEKASESKRPSTGKLRETVAGILRGADFQPKLEVGDPDDIYEREAEKIAEQVMTCPGGCSGDDDEEDDEDRLEIRRSPESGDMIRRQTEQSDPEVFAQDEDALVREIPERMKKVLAGGTSLLDADRDFFQARFGRDLSRIRVHADFEAGQLAHGLGAKAFTHGNHLVFGPGRHEPGTQRGRKLMAHELAHAIQQGQAPALPPREIRKNKPSEQKTPETPIPGLEMIPGASRSRLVDVLETSAPPMIQRAKIDHRQLTWEDFKAKAPATGPEAMTYSDFHAPDWDKLEIEVDVEDTGEKCKIDGEEYNKFKATAHIPKDKIILKSYMDQDRSWAKDWVDTPKAMKEKCTKEYVEPCKEYFGEKFTEIEGDRKEAASNCEAYFDKNIQEAKQQAAKFCSEKKQECIEAFDEDAPSYSIWLDEKEITAESRKECSSDFFTLCKKTYTDLVTEPLEYSKTVDDQEAVAQSRDKCKTTFADEYEQLLKDSVNYEVDWPLPGQENSKAETKEQCGENILNECKDTIMPQISDVLLSHEQGHFDITEVFSEKTQEAIRQLSGTLIKEVTECKKEAAVNKAKDELNKEKPLKKLKDKFDGGHDLWDETQDIYDVETDHGRKYPEQQSWESNIDGGLAGIKIP